MLDWPKLPVATGKSAKKLYVTVPNPYMKEVYQKTPKSKSVQEAFPDLLRQVARLGVW